MSDVLGFCFSGTHRQFFVMAILIHSMNSSTVFKSSLCSFNFFLFTLLLGSCYLLPYSSHSHKDEISYFDFEFYLVASSVNHFCLLNFFVKDLFIFTGKSDIHRGRDSG